jgi:hypothetical protein
MRYINLVNNIVVGDINTTGEFNHDGWIANADAIIGDIYNPDTDTFSAPVAQEITSKPQIALTNIAITEANLNGAIYWMPINTAFALTANVQLPNSQMMVMIEQVVRDENGVYQVVNDVRVIANIVDGVVTIKAKFEKSGNYRIKAERLNLGLDEIGAPFNLSFDLIEFDAHEPEPV